MKVLVTGSNGQLGNEMRRVASELCAEHEFIFTDVAELDITDSESVLQAAEGVGVIVNCAAFTNVDAAEENEALAYQLNAEAVSNLAAAAKAQGALLVHISTDYVFGGDGNTPRVEDSPTKPLGAYGRTKLAGEQAALQSGCRSIIIRTAWLYSIHGKNFVKTMLSLMESRPSLNVVFDQVGTPTYAGDLADAIGTIINTPSPAEGVYHYSNEGVCSWYDFAVAIAQLAGSSCKVKPCHSSEFPSKVQRPAFSVLDKTKIRSVFHLSIPHWHASLKRCVAKLQGFTKDDLRFTNSDNGGSAAGK
ncbi:MAG: dTDP-4-dehydrorhamnose reductase [Akkermansia sp.]|nr:dTDP-4-dehydrorhamnose reductase [Akkermansia sp.]